MLARLQMRANQQTMLELETLVIAMRSWLFAAFRDMKREGVG